MIIVEAIQFAFSCLDDVTDLIIICHIKGQDSVSLNLLDQTKILLEMNIMARPITPLTTCGPCGPTLTIPMKQPKQNKIDLFPPDPRKTVS